MKRLLSVLIILFLLVFPVALAFADEATEPSHIALTDGGKPTLVDNADLLNESQEKTLSEKLREIGTRYQCDVIVVTVNSLDGKTAEAYAEDFFSYNGYGYGATPDENGTAIDGDGIIMLLSMEGGAGNRDCRVSATGFGSVAVTDYALLEYLEPAFLPYFRNDNFPAGLNAFADGCDKLLKMARDGDPYDCFHIVTDDGYLSGSERSALQSEMVRIFNTYDTLLYFVYKPSVTDTDAFVSKIRGEGRIPGGMNVLLFISNGDEYDLKAFGDVASKVQEKDVQAMADAVSMLRDDRISDAVRSFTTQCETILTRKPMNWFTLALGVLSGGLLGFVPVNKMKRQLTDVSKQKNADKYLEPNSFVLTQNSDVLLRTNVSRTVHVVQSDSSGGRSGGGGGFHGGSSTHTSSSGGTFSGHTSKF